ncbi:MAG: hypothetical protein QGI63_01090 [Rhodospirillales bacterium]|jgi:hypothetical protein|nr:hypothetical protein [Rhodospirillales bacterium]MDP6772839.1 hypothetical protein [Rhodospirillales bacterium]|tara:strand:+ start:49 stop:420 length:372 start_codon:yes stop_codon:yes gene_type:complete
MVDSFHKPDFPQERGSLGYGDWKVSVLVDFLFGEKGMAGSFRFVMSHKLDDDFGLCAGPHAKEFRRMSSLDQQISRKSLARVTEVNNGNGDGGPVFHQHERSRRCENHEQREKAYRAEQHEAT